eukprot:TRINITY_DN72758_c0_g1_i1.p1 TRINITY_DN72758_c0_g1~~TRINITY_DN72758_c0_g1_i1.p1  ORF type:complete len:323 (-),score=3.80 TRINITY_DN72758_c0_g1_i1:62-949(-)
MSENTQDIVKFDLVISSPRTAAFLPKSIDEIPESCWSKFCNILCPCSIFSINFLLMLINVAVFATTLLISIVWEIPFVCVLYRAGAAYGYDLKYYFAVHRLIMPTFLHLNTAHLLSNLCGMIMFGFDCEKHMGLHRFLVMYLIGGIVGAFAQSVLDFRGGVGASAAIMAIVGYMFMYTISVMHTIRENMYIYVRMFLVTVLSLFIPQEGVAYFAHLGGAYVGVAAAFEFLKVDADSYLNKEQGKNFMRLLSIIAGGTLFLYFLLEEIPASETPCQSNILTSFCTFTSQLIDYCQQ